MDDNDNILRLQTSRQGFDVGRHAEGEKGGKDVTIVDQVNSDLNKQMTKSSTMNPYTLFLFVSLLRYLKCKLSN